MAKVLNGAARGCEPAHLTLAECLALSFAVASSNLAI
jgi:hypothetical protein